MEDRWTPSFKTSFGQRLSWEYKHITCAYPRRVLPIPYSCCGSSFCRACGSFFFFLFFIGYYLNHKLPRWLSGKESACQRRRCEFDPWVRKIPWRRKGNPLQYSCLENPMDRGAWQATVHGVAKSQT